MNAGENKPTGLVKDMDTSILNTLSLIAPDLMEEIELRALILERVAALEPIGRRALAARLHLAEREVRAAAEALKKAGCLTQSASGMELTPQGQSLVEAARAVSGGRRTLSGIELTLSQMLGVERVCVVRGDADIDSGVMEEVARAAARQIRFLLQGAHVMAVTGGRTVAKTAEAIAVAAPMEITVVPAQGGMGGGVAYNKTEFEEICARGLDLSPVSEILIEESLIGWKEFEMEVMRDRADNCVVICSIENIDAMGVHTGDSITVAPIQTLTDREYQVMRDASFAVIREIGVETGGSNIQFAINPANGRMIVIEMNSRVSRSSALASKATGFPIAKLAAKLTGLKIDIKGDRSLRGEEEAAADA